MVELIWANVFFTICTVFVYLLSGVIAIPEEIIPGVDKQILCPAICMCNNLTQHRVIVDCRNRDLNKVPSSLPNNTVQLFLDNNALQHLENLDQVPSLEVITLTYNSLLNVPSHAFYRLLKLKHLDISRNRLGNYTINGALYNLSYLQSLNLSSNFIQYIPDIEFHGLGSLISLNLSYNVLSGIDKNAFKDLQNLDLLDLSHNQLTDLQEEWLLGLGNLQKLLLSHNRIQNISNILFQSLTSLKILDLSHNEISLVGRLSFKGLSKVINLDLSYNNISILQENIFRNMDELLEVNLSYNPLISFDGTFKSSPNILSLNLEHTKNLRELKASSLQGLSGLIILQLSHSALSSIHPQAFSELVKLKELHLDKCQLKTIPKDVFKSLSFLHNLILQGNPWHCDCLLFWLLKWIEVNEANLLKSQETLCQTPDPLKRSPILESLDHHITCINASAEAVTTKPDFLLGSEALLSCRITGEPKPSLSWLTPKNVMLYMEANSSTIQHSSFQVPTRHDLVESIMQPFELLPNGSLKVKNVDRAVVGVYKCTAHNALSNSTARISLILNRMFMKDIRLMSIWVGMATSGGFLFLTLVVQFVLWIADRCGWNCICCRRTRSHKGQQLWHVLENMEGHKSQQLERLRENYNIQAQKIKDNCLQQMEWLRESYSCQVEKLRDIRDYGTQQIDKIRDNYYFQVQKVRDYSKMQIDRLRENYVFQRTRIRKFSAHQLFKLREHYKLQQQHLNKILENLNLENCKVNCSRTDSIFLDSPELTLQPANLPINLMYIDLDFSETGSQMSAYYTPNDSNSETSSSIFDTNQYVNKNSVILDTYMTDAGCSTTDLHLYQSNSTQDIGIPNSSVQETVAFAMDHESQFLCSSPYNSDMSINKTSTDAHC